MRVGDAQAFRNNFFNVAIVKRQRGCCCIVVVILDSESLLPELRQTGHRPDSLPLR